MNDPDVSGYDIPNEEWDAATAIGVGSLPSLADDLGRFLEEGEPDYDSEPVPAESLDQANRWLRRIARLDREAGQIKAAAITERSRIAEWEADRLAPIAKQRAWLERSCEQLTRALFARDEKTVTYNVPNGKLYSRAKPAEFEYDDEAVFVAWAVEHRPELVNTPEPVSKPDKVAVKKAFADLVPKKPRVGDEIAVIARADDGTVIPVPGVRIVIPDRTWKLDAT